MGEWLAGVFDSRTKLSPANVQHSLLSMLVFNWTGCLNPAQGSAWCSVCSLWWSSDRWLLVVSQHWPASFWFRKTCSVSECDPGSQVLEVKAALYPFTAVHVFFLAFSITAKCLLFISWFYVVDLFAERCSLIPGSGWGPRQQTLTPDSVSYCHPLKPRFIWPFTLDQFAVAQQVWNQDPGVLRSAKLRRDDNVKTTIRTFQRPLGFRCNLKTLAWIGSRKF